MPKTSVEDNINQSLRNRRRILVVGMAGVFGDSIIRHSVPLAQRLKYDLVAVGIDTMFEGKAFEKRSAESAKILMSEALRNGIHCDHLVRSGDLAGALEDLVHELKRVELVVLDSTDDEERIGNLPVPVATIPSITNVKRRGDVTMPTGNDISKSRFFAKAVSYGVFSAALYSVIFMNADKVMGYFTKGGLYAALPIATALVFSFVHGSFAHNLWSLLGIEALKKDRLRQTEQKVVEKRKRLRRRPRVYAYVNPFHRIDID